MRLAIDIAVEHEAWHALGDLDALAERAVATAIAESGVEVAMAAELSLLLCDDARIHNLNRRWRGKDRPTNVLSFPSEDDALLGDIAVAFETAAREAREASRPLADHLTHLLIHGFLHLLGFDHENDADADAMEALEGRTLLALGIASPYDEVEGVSP